jgi:anti-sigma factor RsiW
MTKHASSPSNADELLSAYLDGELNDRERQQVSAMLQSDPDAVASLTQLRYVADLMGQAPRQPVPRAFTLTEEQVAVRRQPAFDLLAWLRPMLMRGATAMIALCLVFLVAGDLSFRLQGPEATLPAISGEQSPALVDEGQVDQVQAKREDEKSTSQASDAAEAVSQAASESNAPPQAFLGLTPTALLALEIGLAVMLVLLLLAQWQLARTP